MAKTLANGTVWSADDVIAVCPLCDAFSIVELTPELKAKQPDGTTHVCHVGFGGCNHGFALEKESVS